MLIVELQIERRLNHFYSQWNGIYIHIYEAKDLEDGNRSRGYHVLCRHYWYKIWGVRVTLIHQWRGIENRFKWIYVISKKMSYLHR